MGPTSPREWRCRRTSRGHSGHQPDHRLRQGQPGNNPISGVQVYANATINGSSYNTQANTDGNGNYSLNVANGGWNISVYCCCDNNSLDSILAPAIISVRTIKTSNIAITTAPRISTVQLCSGVQDQHDQPADGPGRRFLRSILASFQCSQATALDLERPAEFPVQPGLSIPMAKSTGRPRLGHI